MTIQFDAIPSSIRKPTCAMEFNTSLAVRSLPQNRQKMLIVGQKTSEGSVAALTPIEVYSDAEAAAYFGYGSICHLMTLAALNANRYVALSVIAMEDDVAGVAATGTVTISGEATAAGTLTLRLGNRSVSIAVATGDAVGDIASALAAAVNADTSLPVTASANLGVVTLTAKNAGVLGNQIDLAYEATGGCCTAVIVAMGDDTAGSGDPDIDDALAVVFDEQYHIIASPYNDASSLGKLRDHMDSVSGPLEQHDGVGAYGYDGLLADCTTLMSGINAGRMTGIYLRGTRSLQYELAAAYGSVIAFEEDPARPLNTLELDGIHAPDIGDRLSRTEQESCLWNGVTPGEVGPGGKVRIVRAVTNYVENALGVADPALLDLTTIRTLDYVRKATRERVALRFPRSKLLARTLNQVKSETIDVLKRLEELEIVENVDDNIDGIIVEVSGTDPNRVNEQIPVDVVNGLHVFAGRIDLIL